METFSLGFEENGAAQSPDEYGPLFHTPCVLCSGFLHTLNIRYTRLQIKNCFDNGPTTRLWHQNGQYSPQTVRGSKLPTLTVLIALENNSCPAWDSPEVQPAVHKTSHCAASARGLLSLLSPLFEKGWSPDYMHVLCYQVSVCLSLNTSKQKAWRRWHKNYSGNRGRARTCGFNNAVEGLRPHG